MLRNLPFILLGIIFCCFTSSLKGQQEVQYSQFHHLGSNFNPAASGTSYALVLDAAYRWQWLGLNGGPQSQLVNVSLPLPLFRSGIGLNIQNDQLGASRLSSVALHYNYRFIDTRDAVLTLGLRAGALQYALNGADLLAPDGFYEGVIDHSDALLPNQNISAITADLGAGVYYLNDMLHIGLAANSLIPARLSADGPDVAFSYTRKMQLNAFSSVKIGLLNNINVIPALFFHSDITKHQLQLNAVIEIDERYEVGSGYRGYSGASNDALVLMGGIKLLENWRLGYSYDLGLSGLKTVHNGSHELRLRFSSSALLPSQKSKVIYNPRFL